MARRPVVHRSRQNPGHASPPAATLRGMRVDLTVRTGDGSVRDVAVLARAGASWAEVRAAAPRLFSGDECSGGAPLAAGTALGSPQLCNGRVVSLGVPDQAADVRTPQRLHVVGGPAAGRAYPLAGGTMTIGRAGECEICLPDPDVSRRHAKLVVTPHGVRIHDLGSTNGLLVDGAQVGVGGVELRPGSIARLGDSLIEVAVVDDPPAALHEGVDGIRLVNRPPRLRPPIAAREIAVPERRDGGRPQPVQWIAALAPAVAGLVLAATMHSPQFLVFALLSPAVVLATALGDRVHWRRDRRRAARSHHRSVEAAEREIEAGLRAETDLRRRLHPDPAAVHALTAGPTSRLWERDLADADALTARVGLGRIPATLTARRGAAVGPAGVLADVPLVADLRVGGLGISGPPGIGAELARWVLAQLSALHPPSELEVALLLTDAAARSWAWARWLPHVRDKVAATPDDHRRLIAELAATVERRRAANGTDAAHSPWLVVVVDRAGTLTDLPGLRTLLTAPPHARVTAICVDTSPQRLPTGCATVARICGETGTRVQLTTGADGRPVEAVADRVDGAWAESLARALAPLSDAGADSAAAIPGSCRLLDVLGMDDLDPDRLLQRWSVDGGAATVVGVGADGPVRVDLVRDGPHALVAGTTGSGKSELLQSLIAGLAASHPPDALGFVLVDYKGGAAFGPCVRLPHTTGLVTDLDPHLTARALRSLDAELRRREELFARHGVGDLESYRACGTGGPGGTGEPDEPLARLVLIVDEFAALAEELPDFVTGLVGLAQRGRSLGIHLVLATQRPGGVVSPEIRANATLRIALRVTDPAESIDVLGSDVAAGLDRRRPGRAFVRAGSTLTQLQVGRVAGPAPVDGAPGIRVELLDDWRRLPAAPISDGPTTDLERLVDAVAGAANRWGRAPARRPWLPELPSLLTVDDLGPAATESTVRVGLVDVPAAQQQEPLELDLAAGGSILLSGGSGSGRTTALLSIALAAARQLGPHALHVHVLDFGGGLDVLGVLPHVGTMLGRGSAELAGVLLSRLEQEVARRQAVLSAAGTASVSEGRAAGCDLPLMLVLVDGWEAFVLAADETDHGRGVESLLAVARTAASVGITLVLAGDRGSLAPRVAGAMSMRLVLRLADRADLALAGIPARSAPERMPPGRAVRCGDCAEIQLAVAGQGPDRAETRRVAEEVARRWTQPDTSGDAFAAPVGTTPIRVRRLPTHAELSSFAPHPDRAVLGVGGDDATPISIDPFAGAARLLVAGPPRSGRSTVLRTVLCQLSAAAAAGSSPPTRIVIAAPPRSPLQAEGIRTGAAVFDPNDEFDPTVVSGQGRTLVLVDDIEAFADTAVGDGLAALSRSSTDLALLAAGRTDDLLLTFRGLAVELRRARCCLLLQPGPGDGELVGMRLPPQRAPAVPGRGLLVADPAWGVTSDATPLRIQVAAG